MNGSDHIAALEEATGGPVSRETLDGLEAFADLLIRWNRRINLIAPSTADDLWARHIIDSAQLLSHAPDAENWIDLGSGAGFPGLVVAALKARPEFRMTLVESDTRKAAFLREAARAFKIAPDIRTTRAETLSDPRFDVVSARAFAPLPALLDHASRLLAPGGTALFPKGARHQEEVDAARLSWQFTLRTAPSVTNSDAAILVMKDLRRV